MVLVFLFGLSKPNKANGYPSQRVNRRTLSLKQILHETFTVKQLLTLALVSLRKFTHICNLLQLESLQQYFSSHLFTVCHHNQLIQHDTNRCFFSFKILLNFKKQVTHICFLPLPYTGVCVGGGGYSFSISFFFPIAATSILLINLKFKLINSIYKKNDIKNLRIKQ